MVIRGFKTSNTVYYIDLLNHLVWGGKLGTNPMKYSNARVIIGCPAMFYFMNGGFMQTSVVLDYLY